MADEPTGASVIESLRGAAAAARSAEGRAVGLWSTSTIVGLHWESVGAGGSGFVGSAPLQGKVELEGLLFSVQKVPAGEDPHRFRFGVTSDVPASESALASVHQLFVRASQAAGSRSDIVVCWGDAGLFLPVSALINMMGRRLVGRWYNGSALTCDAYVAFVLHEVVGGEGGVGAGFMAGEAVTER